LTAYLFIVFTAFVIGFAIVIAIVSDTGIVVINQSMSRRALFFSFVWHLLAFKTLRIGCLSSLQRFIGLFRFIGLIVASFEILGFWRNAPLTPTRWSNTCTRRKTIVVFGRAIIGETTRR